MLQNGMKVDICAVYDIADIGAAIEKHADPNKAGRIIIKVEGAARGLA